MRSFLLSIILLSLLATGATAEESRFTGKVWLDVFGGSQGVVYYPQYFWQFTVGKVWDVKSFGFIEGAPHEPKDFTNHLIWITHARAPFFSVHTEQGGVPSKGRSFYQIGPRINLTEAIPGLKPTMSRLFVTALPHLKGVRPNNLLIGGGTNQFKISSGLKTSTEGFRRFFPGKRPDYAEYWQLFHFQNGWMSHFSLAAFVLHDGSRASLYFGLRIQ